MDVEHLIYEVCVQSQVSWSGYVLTCPECSSDSSWSLRVQQPPWTHGEKAWGLCVLGHKMIHPLIYPEFVHALIDWAAGDDRARTVEEVLIDLPWIPHRVEWRDAEYSDELHRVLYWPVTHHRGGNLDYWRRAYPELVEAGGWDTQPPASDAGQV